MPSWLTDLIKHTPLLQDAIETLYLYKLSMCFSVHFLLVVGLPICIMWVMIVLEKLKIESKEYPLSNSHSRVSRMDYAERCAQET